MTFTPYAPWRSKLRVHGTVLPIGSYIGVNERWAEVDDIEKKKDLNGYRVLFRPLWMPRIKMIFSASGAAVRHVPNFYRIPKDEPVWIESSKRITEGLPAGQTSIVLWRPPVAGSLRAFYAGDRAETPVEVGYADGVLTAPASEHDLSFSYQPAFYATRNDASSGAPEITGNVEWSSEWEEEPLPL